MGYELSWCGGLINGFDNHKINFHLTNCVNQTEFIHLGFFEKRAQNLLEVIKSSKKDFCKKSDILKADKDLEILLGYLQFKSVSIDICEIDEEVYIKDSKFNG